MRIWHYFTISGLLVVALAPLIQFPERVYTGIIGIFLTIAGSIICFKENLED